MFRFAIIQECASRSLGPENDPKSPIYEPHDKIILEIQYEEICTRLKDKIHRRLSSLSTRSGVTRAVQESLDEIRDECKQRSILLK